MENLIILAIVGIIVGLAGGYVYRAKKRGVKCVGCPSGCSCSKGSCGGNCGGCGGNCGGCGEA